MFYKDPAGALHFLEDDYFTHLLPEGSVPITNEEADVIQERNAPKPSYAELRAAAYPPIGDQLDAIMKAALGDNGDIKRIAEQCAAVKAEFPKDQE